MLCPYFDCVTNSFLEQKGKTSVLPSKNCFAILVGIPPLYEHFPMPEQSGQAHFARHRTEEDCILAERFYIIGNSFPIM